MKDDDEGSSSDSGDWGMAPKSGGFSREAKIGLVLVLVIAGVFGAVYYKKASRQKALLAAAANPDDPSNPDDDSVKPTEPKKDKNVAPVNGEEGDNPFGDDPAPPVATSKPGAASRHVAARNAPSDDEPSDLFHPPAAARSTRPAPPPPASDNPFDEEPGSTAVARAPARSAEPDGFDQAEPAPTGRAAAPAARAPAADDGFDDPFAGETASTAAPEPPGEFPATGPGDARAAGHHANARDEFSELDAPPARATPRSTASASNNTSASPFGGPARAIPRAAAPQPPHTAVSRPPVAAPIDHGDGDFQPPVVTTAKPRTMASDPFSTAGASPAAVGDNRPSVYEVQPNDNFWKISSKQYGTAKYFQALAYANADRIPDATKLRPGMKVVTPSAQELEARYPQLFPKAGGSAGEEESPAGLFVSRTGQPLYRVGTNDTLNTIARAHLGRSSRWIQIFELNRDQLKTPNDLKPGNVLRLPLDASNVRMAHDGATIR